MHDPKNSSDMCLVTYGFHPLCYFQRRDLFCLDFELTSIPLERLLLSSHLQPSFLLKIVERESL